MKRSHASCHINARNQIRIIGGEWRGRKLSFSDAPGLRPTPDRVRETLFNWLQPGIYGSRCLDLFAGTGVLGFEALSRGAGSVTMIEKSRYVTQMIRENVQVLKIAPQRLKLIESDAMAWMENQSEWPFDVVFIDPPYQSGLLEPVLQKIVSIPGANGCKLYYEYAADQLIELPTQLNVLKQKKAGQVMYQLAICDIE